MSWLTYKLWELQWFINSRWREILIVLSIVPIWIYGIFELVIRIIH